MEVKPKVSLGESSRSRCLLPSTVVVTVGSQWALGQIVKKEYLLWFQKSVGLKESQESGREMVKEKSEAFNQKLCDWLLIPSYKDKATVIPQLNFSGILSTCQGHQCNPCPSGDYFTQEFRSAKEKSLKLQEQSGMPRSDPQMFIVLQVSIFKVFIVGTNLKTVAFQIRTLI